MTTGEVRKRIRWNRDLVVDIEPSELIAERGGRGAAVLRVVNPRVERHRRRVGVVRG